MFQTQWCKGPQMKILLFHFVAFIVHTIFCLHFSQKQSANQLKKIQENVWLLNWKAHAKFLALMKEKKFTWKSHFHVGQSCTKPFNFVNCLGFSIRNALLFTNILFRFQFVLLASWFPCTVSTCMYKCNCMKLMDWTLNFLSWWEDEGAQLNFIILFVCLFLNRNIAVLTLEIILFASLTKSLEHTSKWNTLSQLFTQADRS